jgi:hypothetical protein
MVEPQEEPLEMILGSGKQIKIKGKFIGILDNGIFVAERKLHKKFRLYNGWGLSRTLINQLVQVGAKRIIFKIKDEESKILVYTLEVTPINWQNRGIPYHNPALKEDQFVLPETSFDRKVIPSLRVVK